MGDKSTLLPFQSSPKRSFYIFVLRDLPPPRSFIIWLYDSCSLSLHRHPVPSSPITCPKRFNTFWWVKEFWDCKKWVMKKWKRMKSCPWFRRGRHSTTTGPSTPSLTLAKLVQKSPYHCTLSPSAIPYQHQGLDFSPYLHKLEFHKFSETSHPT